jgi:hypothetical protein
MQLTPVNCNHCGASLEIPQGARFVTCRYCNSQLQIHRTDSTVTTEVLQRIDQNTATMAQDLQVIRHESEVERLDREWQLRQAELLVRDKHGSASPPSAAGGILSAVFMAIIGIVVLIGGFSFSSNSPKTISVPGNPPITIYPEHSPSPDIPQPFACIIPLVGVGLLVGAVIMGIHTTSAAGRYEEEYRKYLTRRAELLRNSPMASNSSMETRSP